MRYILFILILICNSRIANGQVVTQPGLRDYQVSGANLPDSVLYILGTDTLDGSAKQGLGKFLTAESLRGFFKDTDWLKYLTGTIPNNTDTMYHIGFVTIGDDSIYGGKLNLLGRADFRYPLATSTNVAIGKNSGNLSATGLDGNMSIGESAGAGLANSTTSNVLMGFNSGATLVGSNQNTGIGGYTLDSIRSGANLNVAIGYGAIQKIRGTVSTQNIGIGYNALNTIKGNANLSNIAIGGSTMATLTGARNVAIGQGALTALAGSNNTVVGHGSFATNTTGSGNVSLGYQSGANETGSNKLYIDNSNTATPLIHGDLSADTLRINGDLSIRDAVSGASTDSVLVWTPSNGRVKMRNASAFAGADDWGTDVVNTDLTLTGDGTVGNVLKVDTSEIATQFDLVGVGTTNLSISQSGATQVIQSSTGTDVGVRNLYGLLITEGATDTLHFRVDSSKLATQFDISGFGTMSNFLLAASGTGGTETITNGETVTVSETTGLDVTRSTNTVAVALSIDEFSTDAVNEGDELLLAYDPSGTNHELFDINNLPYVAAEVDGSTTNEAWTVDADAGDTEVISNQTVLFDGTGIVTTTYTASSNTLAIGATEVDGSVTNEAWTIDGDIGSVPEVITTQTVLFTGSGGIQTDWDGVNNELIIDASGVTGTGDGNGIYDGSGTVPTTTVATLTDNLTFNTGASEADLFIDGTNDLIGIGTNSPEQQLTISNEDSNISYPIMAFHTDQTGSGTAVIGTTNYLYGAEALAAVSTQKKTSTGSNDAVYMIDMMDSGGAAENALDITIKDAYAKNRPRLNLYGAMQHSSVDSIGANTTLDESYFAVRCTTSTITITLPNANTTNNEWIGTQYWIYNNSGGNITIDPNGTNDTVNGSNANITVANNAGYYLMLMSTTAGAVNNWMALKTP